MSDVTRYAFDMAACWHEHPDGEFVEHNAYAKLEAAAQALREEVARGNRITLAMALDIAAVGVALGIPGEQQEGGTGEFIEAIQSLQKELEALRARVVVPDGYALMPLEPSPEMRLASHRYKRKNKVSTGPGFWRAMAEAAPRLNGLTVSASALDTLRRFATGEVGHLNSGHCPDDLEGRSARDPNCSVCRALIDTEKSK